MDSKFLKETGNGLAILIESLQQILSISAKTGNIKIGPFAVSGRSFTEGGYEGIIGIGSISLQVTPSDFVMTIPGVGSMTGIRNKGIVLSLQDTADFSSDNLKLRAGKADIETGELSTRISGEAALSFLKNTAAKFAGEFLLQGGSILIKASSLFISAGNAEVKTESLKIGASKGMDIRSGDSIKQHSGTGGIVLSSGSGNDSVSGTAGYIKNICKMYTIRADNIKITEGMGTVSAVARVTELNFVLNTLCAALLSCASSLSGATDPGAKAAGVALNAAINTLKAAPQYSNIGSKCVKVV